MFRGSIFVLGLFAAALLLPMAQAQEDPYQTLCGPVDSADNASLRNIGIWRTEIGARLRHERYLVDKTYISTIEHPNITKIKRAPDGTRIPKITDPKDSPPKKINLTPFERLRNFFVGKQTGSPVTTDFMINGAKVNVAQIYQANASNGWQVVLQKITEDTLNRYPNMDPGVADVVARYVLIQHLQSLIEAHYESIVTDLDRWRCLQNYSTDVNAGFGLFDFATSLTNINNAQDHYDNHLRIEFTGDEIDLSVFLDFMTEARDVAVAVLPDIEEIENYTRDIRARPLPIERALSTNVASQSWNTVNGESFITTAVDAVPPIENGLSTMNAAIAELQTFPTQGPFDDDDFARIQQILTDFSTGGTQVFTVLTNLKTLWINNNRYLSTFPNPSSQYRMPIDTEAALSSTRARASMDEIDTLNQVIQSIQ